MSARIWGKKMAGRCAFEDCGDPACRVCWWGRQMLTDSMAGLRPIEQEVLRRRFGLDGDEETLAEIGSTMNRGPERVRQIEARALRKLRHPSRSRALRPFLDVRV